MSEQRFSEQSLPGASARRLPTASDDVEVVKVSDADIQVHKPMSARTKARKQALDVLYEAEAKRIEPVVVLDEHIRLGEPAVRPLAIDIVRGVSDELDAIDDRIAAASAWPIDRMTSVDRQLARIATWEMGFNALAPEVAISEAVLLADELSTDESATYLNGLLAAVAGNNPAPARESRPEGKGVAQQDADDIEHTGDADA